MDTAKKNSYTGIALALITVIVWSGNFIIARGLYKQIPPIGLAFYRWSLASVTIFFLGYKKFAAEKIFVFKNWKYFFGCLFSALLYSTHLFI